MWFTILELRSGEGLSVLDRFPEALRRFERVVDIRRIRSFRQLLLAFRWWSGENWRGTKGQMIALKVEAVKRGIPIPAPRRLIFPQLRTIRIPRKTWKHEILIVRGKPQHRFRDLRTGRFVKKPSRNL